MHGIMPGMGRPLALRSAAQRERSGAQQRRSSAQYAAQAGRPGSFGLL
jgi:hypothetical protein